MSPATRILIGLFALASLMLFAPARDVCAQLTVSEEERLKLLTDPDAIAKKAEKDKARPPVEFFRSQVAPFDVLPYVKANHWSTFSVDLTSNDADYEGALQTEPLKLLGMPQEVIFGREARLVKEQRSNLAFQVLCSTVPKETPIELIKPGAIRADGVWQASLMTLPRQQMLVMILSKDATSRFSAWGRLPSMIPSKAPLDDLQALELQRYYRLVLPTEPDKIYLPPHPLAWSTLSHVVWDGISPDTLSVAQQQAMLDWIHWGGQLILCGGASATSTLFRESFLAPYLPGERTGETRVLKSDDLEILSRAYPPSTQTARSATGAIGESEPVPITRAQREERIKRVAYRYQPPEPIRTKPNEPVHVAEIRPKPGASKVPLGGASPHLLAVESRVGRGRITMLTIDPNEPALVTWPGLDTLVRRVILRRPEESMIRPGGFDGDAVRPPELAALSASDLSWYRIASRDGLGVPAHSEPAPRPAIRPPVEGVADWLDNAFFPRLARDLLEDASGISIPSSRFVLKVIFIYVLTLVPLNWLFCRVLLRRKEWSWLFIPLISLGFAVGVERMAAFDVGFDSSCDEIDMLEIQGDYGRAHLSRFSALFTTGRGLFSISFPGDPTALALPLDTGRSIGGEDIVTTGLQSYPVPTLSNVSVQPRSLGMVRAEQMINVGAGIALEGDDSDQRVTNRTELELRDAFLITFDADGKRVERHLGSLAAGASVDLKEAGDRVSPGPIEGFEGPDPSPFLSELRSARDLRPENAGEVRLVAWIDKPMGGMKIEPAVDRHRGSTVVIARLRHAPPPDPDDACYNFLAGGPESLNLPVMEPDSHRPPASPPARRPRRR